MKTRGTQYIKYIYNKIKSKGTKLASKWTYIHQTCKGIITRQQTCSYKMNPNKIVKW